MGLLRLQVPLVLTRKRAAKPLDFRRLAPYPYWEILLLWGILSADALHFHRTGTFDFVVAWSSSTSHDGMGISLLSGTPLPSRRTCSLLWPSHRLRLLLLVHVVNVVLQQLGTASRLAKALAKTVGSGTAIAIALQRRTHRGQFRTDSRAF